MYPKAANLRPGAKEIASSFSVSMSRRRLFAVSITGRMEEKV